MKIADKVIDAAFESNEVFQQRLSKMIKEDLGLTALEFSEQADDPSKHSLQNPFRKQGAKHKDISIDREDYTQDREIRVLRVHCSDSSAEDRVNGRVINWIAN